MSTIKSHLYHILKDLQLLWAMLLGVIFYPLFVHLGSLLPCLIFAMLSFNYTKISPKDLKPRWQHFLLLGLTLVMAILAYFILLPVHPLLALGGLILFVTPTATAAGVITLILGGDLSFVTSYLILGNVLCALVVPFIASLFGVGAIYDPITTFLEVIYQVLFLLMGPLLLVWAFRYTLPKVHRKLESWSGATLYLWCTALAIITARTIHFFIEHDDMSPSFVWTILLGTMGICLLSFAIGRFLGSKTMNSPVTMGQSFGQKNTILAIWIATAFFDPLASLVPAAYVFWQNVVNATQLALHRKRLRQTEKMK